MEPRELELLEQYADQDAELKALWQQHVDFEKMLEKMESRPYNSPTQLQEIRELKKKKLAGKTKLLHILDQYSKKEA